MRRLLRWRNLIRSLVVLLLLAGGLVGLFIGSGGIERAIERRFAAELPGRLVVESVDLEGIDQAGVRGIRLLDRDERLIAELPRVRAIGDLIGGRPERIDVTELTLHLDDATLPYWREVITRFLPPRRGPAPATAPSPPRPPAPAPGPPFPVQIDLQAIDLLVAGEPLLQDWRVLVDRGSDGGVAVLVRQPDGEALISRTADGIWSVHVSGAWPIRPLLQAAAGLGQLALPDTLQPLLPERIALDGTRLQIGRRVTGSVAIDLLRPELPLGRLVAEIDGRAESIDAIVGWNWTGVADPWNGHLNWQPEEQRLTMVECAGPIPIDALAKLAQDLDLLTPQQLGLAIVLQSNLPQCRMVPSQVSIDYATDFDLRGQAGLVWEGGSLSVSFERGEGWRLAPLAVGSDIWGSITGALDLSPTGAGRLTWTSLHLGPQVVALLDPIGLGIGFDLAGFVGDMQARFPTGELRWQEEAGRPSIDLDLHGAEGAHLTAHLAGDRSGQIEARNIPLSLLRHIAPELRLENGQVTSATARQTADGWDLDAAITAIHSDFGDWELVGLDGRLRYRSLPEGRFAARWTLSGKRGSIDYVGTTRAGRLQIDLPHIESVLTAIRGPYQLPTWRGGIAGSITLTEPAMAGAIPLSIGGIRLDGFHWPGLVSGLDASLSGRLTWWKGRLEADLGGTFSDGVLFAGGLDLAIAEGAPEWKAAVGWSAAQRHLQLHSFVVRGPLGAAEPRFTASARGDLHDGDKPQGSLQVVIDPVHLGWLHRTLGASELVQEISLDGSASLVATVARQEGDWILREGWVLPGGTSMTLLDGVLTLEGVRGSIHLPPQRIPTDIRSLDPSGGADDEAPGDQDHAGTQQP